jgi:hypothetical protein
MKGRCKVCGIVTDSGTTCNSCSIALEERRFFRMVNREELNSTLRTINRRKKSHQSDAITESYHK